jgi:hypothetical protein
MAQKQCPNCGGYCTCSWASGVAYFYLCMVVVTVCTLGLAAVITVPLSLWVWFARPGSVFGHYECQLCAYGWETDDSRPARPMLARATQPDNRRYSGG